MLLEHSLLVLQCHTFAILVIIAVSNNRIGCSLDESVLVFGRDVVIDVGHYRLGVCVDYPLLVGIGIQYRLYFFEHFGQTGTTFTFFFY